ncbi:PREDICTED: uncharacterized protein LOC107357541 isoform X2 [Acropora digitifera]|uniref:uncharacterized protein LOC107357541 isoform X2 n=1 Tax=Acropora digitifera TaxID=70779 RepID=UPI00077AA6E7|nr:PREDICTED: uncharacterized protein LOC107357541 isoform X2 [Acropora digitifera]
MRGNKTHDHCVIKPGQRIQWGQRKDIFHADHDTSDKHEALLHNFKPMYCIDQRETIQLWAKVIPERWQDNRLIGSLSNTDYLAFNLTSWETSSETQGIGVTTRDVLWGLADNGRCSLS